MSTLSSSIGTSFASATAKKNSAPFTFSSKMFSSLLAAVVVIIIRFAATPYRFFTRVDADKSKSNVPFPRSFAQRMTSSFPQTPTTSKSSPTSTRRRTRCLQSYKTTSSRLFFFPLIVLHLERLFRSNAFLRLQFPFRRGPTLKPLLLFPSSG